MKFTFTIILWSLFLSHCGNISTSQGTEIVFFMQANRTGNASNVLIMKDLNPKDFLFKISGSSLSSEIAMDQWHPIRTTTQVDYLRFGTYTLRVEIAQADGTPFISRDLSWVYDDTIPPTPIASFSEEASRDARVDIYLAASRGPLTQEVWLEGDLAKNPQGSWSSIPRTNILQMNLSEGDGIKSVRLKYRNDYGHESEMVTLKILRTSQQPQSCSATPIAFKTANHQIQYKFSAVTEVPMYFRILGDISGISRWTPFAEGEVFAIPLSSGEGDKKLTVQLRDAAENICSQDFEQTITVDYEYSRSALKIADEPLWTDSETVTIVPRYDSFGGEQVEMWLTGNIVADEVVETWIPVPKSLDLKLSPVRGNRYIWAKFRNQAGEESPMVAATIYLRPYVSLQTNSSPPRLILSQILGLREVTISGCNETYDKIAYSQGLVCQHQGNTITATYTLEDGNQISRSYSP